MKDLKVRFKCLGRISSKRLNFLSGNKFWKIMKVFQIFQAMN